MERKQLAGMGFVSNLSSITAEHADRLITIDEKWRELSKEKQEKQAAKDRLKGKSKARRRR